MSRTLNILREATEAVNLIYKSSSNFDAVLASLGIDLKNEEDFAWFTKAAPGLENPVVKTAWLDGFLVALYAGNRLSQPKRVDFYQIVNERAKEIVRLALRESDLSENLRKFLSDDFGVGVVKNGWANGFSTGLSRRQHLTKHRFAGRN